MARPTSLLVAFPAALLVPAVACSTPTATPPVEASIAHPTVSMSTDAATPRDDAGSDAGLHTSVRVALLAPLSFGVDVCLLPIGTNGVFQGPLLYKELPPLPDAGHGGSSAEAGPEAGDARQPDAGKAGGAERDEAGPDGANDSAVDARHDAAHDAAADARSAEAATDARAMEASGVPKEASGDARDAAAEAGADAAASDGDARPAEGGHGDGRSASDASLEATAEAATEGGTDATPDANTGVSATGGVLSNHVTNYLSVTGAGTFQVSIVVGGSSTCSNPLATQQITLEAGKHATLVVLGFASLPVADASADAGKDATVRDASHGSGDAASDATSDAMSDALSILKLTDDPSSAPTLARARFFNATTPADGGNVGLGVVAVEQATAVPLADDVPFEAVGTVSPSHPAVDVLGYWAGAPLLSTTVPPSPIEIRIGAPFESTDGASFLPEAGTLAPFTTFAPPSSGSFDLTAGSNHTGFIIGGGTAPLQLIWCDDQATVSPTSSNSTLSVCSDPL